MKTRVNHMSKPLVDKINDASASLDEANEAISEAILVLRELRDEYGDTNVLSNLIWLLEWNDLVRYAYLLDDSFIDFTGEGDR